MTEPRLVFPLDDNTFIFNGKARASLNLTSPSEAQSPAEQVGPRNLLGGPQGHHRRNLWVGLGLWAFIVMAATVAIPIALGTIGIAIKAKPTPANATLPVSLTFPLFPVASAPAAPPAPSLNVIEDMRRFAKTVTLPIAHPPPPQREIPRSRAERIISHHFITPKPAESQSAPLGCPPSVCFPPQPGQTNPLGQRPSAIDLDEAGQRVTTWSRR